MSNSTLRMATLLAASVAAFGGGAEILKVGGGYASQPAYAPSRGGTRIGNNKAPGPTRAEKKRKRKIQRASRRFNIRRGA